jgi:3-hydroxyisobutyrate dehydrogenase-like beta-hydroxyacid dehydrogenase
MRVGFIGLGSQGAPMAHRIIAEVTMSFCGRAADRRWRSSSIALPQWLIRSPTWALNVMWCVTLTLGAAASASSGQHRR